MSVELHEIAVAGRRAGENPQRAMAREGADMLAAIGRDDYVVALEIAAKTMTTAQLSAWLAERMREGRPLALLIGGPDGPGAAMPGASRSKLVPVAPDSASRPGQGGGRRATLSRHESAGRTPLSSRLRPRGSVSWDHAFRLCLPGLGFSQTARTAATNRRVLSGRGNDRGRGRAAGRAASGLRGSIGGGQG